MARRDKNAKLKKSPAEAMLDLEVLKSITTKRDHVQRQEEFSLLCS